jgi:quinol monooxygenase YgiN
VIGCVGYSESPAVLVIAGFIRIDPTLREELIQTAIGVVRELRKGVGCTQVSLSADLKDRRVFHLPQKRESQAALEANLQWSRIDAIRNYARRPGIPEIPVLKYEIAAADSLGLSGPRRRQGIPCC